MKRIMLILVIMLPLLLVAQSRGEYECQQLSRIAFEKLDLTEIQKEKLHQIRIESKKKIIQMSADLKLAKIELHELMSKDIMSKKLDATIDKVADLKRKMFKAKIKTRVEMKKILTTEQRAKTKELAENKCTREEDAMINPVTKVMAKDTLITE